MADIDNLIVRIKADTKSLQKSLKQIEGKIRVTGATGSAAFGMTGAGLGANLKKLKGPAIAAAGGITAIGVATSKILGVGSTFEDLRDSLDLVFGSAEAGQQAFDDILKFAQTTPFQIDTVTKAFIGLKSAGIEPNLHMLQTFADTASIATDQLGTFEALITFFQRSAAGGASLVELNRINDRGIDIFGRLEGEIGKAREELSTFGQTAEGSRKIQEGLIKVLNRDFGGAMATKMDNLSTKASNMQIAFKNLANEVFKSGLGDFFKDMADNLANIAQSIADSIQASREGPSVRDLTAREETVVTGKTKRGKDIMGTQMVFTDDVEEQKKILKEKIEQFKLDIASLELKKEEQTNRRNIINFEKQIANLLAEQLIHENALASITKDKSDNKKKEIDQSKLANTEQIDFLKTFEKLLEDSVDPIVKINKQMEMVSSLIGKTDIKGALLIDEEDAQQVLDFLQQMKDEMSETIPKAEDLSNVLNDELRQAVVNSSNAFTTDFVNALLDGQNGLESFKDFARSLVSQIISIFMQLAVVNKIINSIFGLTGSDALPTIGGDGGGISQTATFDTGQAGVGGMPLGLGSAGGGSMFKGMPRLVGERGAEIFVPHTSGTLLNNMNSKKAMGGSSTIINQSINFATGIVPTVRAEVTKMLPQIADVTKSAVQESAMRGGSFRRSLTGG